MSQAHDIHRALLRPTIIHTLRAAGFHSTKPSVLDTLVNLAERHLMVLASTTAQHAWSSHNDPVPTVTDVRNALSDCGILTPLDDPAAQAWRERMRIPLSELAAPGQGGSGRVHAEKRKRDDDDTRDVRDFARWYDSSQFREIKRVAAPEANAAMLASVGVGGSVVQTEDFLTVLRKKHSKTGDDSRLQGTVLGRQADDKDFVVEGGPVQHIRDWKPARLKLEERATNVRAAATSGDEDETREAVNGIGEIASTDPYQTSTEGVFSTA